MDNKGPYPLVYEEHDGTWSWSIERGDAFGDDHEVLDRNDGYPNRREAKAAMEVAMGKIREDADDKPSGKQSRAQRAKPAVSAERSPGIDQPATTPLPEWGVVHEGLLVACFMTEKGALEYGKWKYGKDFKTRRVSQALAFVG
ncbi:MAG: hypothetical protein QNJ40_20100 [Xanthomonadales bacterium]|nr:hypothetical protein [Xanthomonadales bacterium]